jgi:hypothetical protein
MFKGNLFCWRGFISFLILGFVGLASGLISSTTFAKPTSIITRNATSGLKVSGSLSQAINIQVPVQVPYDEQVAYEEQETYYENVPYQVDETYTEKVPYQTQESYYENVPYTRIERYYESVPYTDREAYTDYEDYYDSEYQCRTVSDYRDECQNENVCRPGGPPVCQDVTECGIGENGRQSCATRQVCRNSEQECHYEQTCHKVPTNRQECGYVQVRKSREVTKYRDVTRYRNELRTREVTDYRQELRTRIVTKYRDEQRTRTVTKYRQEERTRTVTKYRTEHKCCKTEYRDQYDHDWKMDVDVVFPEGTELTANEVEQFKIQMQGSESAPDVSIAVAQGVFNYTMVTKNIVNDHATITFAATPKFNVGNAGENSIEALQLSFKQSSSNTTESKTTISFIEKVISSRVDSKYSYELKSLTNDQVLSHGDVSVNSLNTAGLAQFIIPELIDSHGKYALTLNVVRTGQNIDGGSLTFSKSFSYEKRDLDESEINAMKSKESLTIPTVLGVGANAKLQFSDNSVIDPDVSTSYKILFYRWTDKVENAKLAMKTINRNDLHVEEGSNLSQISMVDLGIAKRNIDEYIKEGLRVYIKITVTRTSQKYFSATPVSFDRTTFFTLKK